MRKWGVLSLICFLFVLSSIFLANFALGGTSNSTSNQFNVTPDVIRLNWTNSYQDNVTVGSKASFNIVVKFVNDTAIPGNYSQTTPSYEMYLNVTNASGVTSNINTISPSLTNDFVLIKNCVQACAPGRYRGRYYVQNATNASENASTVVFIDLPITISSTTGQGTFSGTLNTTSTYYHSFYVNASSIPSGSTSIKVNLEFDRDDIDLFLLDNSSTPKLLAKSINKTGLVENLSYNFISTDVTYELRLYGNTTNSAGIPYDGKVIFIALDSSNQTLNYGIKNITTGSPQQDEVNLTNEGNIAISGVSESAELYYVKRFSGSAGQNFTVMLPNSTIIEKIEVSANWTGGGNYTLNLYNPSKSLAASSTNKHTYTNFSDVESEEYAETTSIGSTAGNWLITMRNNTNSTPSYSVEVLAYVNESEWISTNYSSYINTTFEVFGGINSSKVIQVNFTVPNSTLDGKYEGYLIYTTGLGAKLKIPIEVNVTTPTLVVNGTMASTTFQLDENYNVTLNRSLYFDVNNTGFYDLDVELTNSSGKLTCYSGNCTGYYANMYHNYFSSIGKYNSQTLNVNVTFNDSMPVAIYRGWIYVNSTNSDPRLTSHPYSGFNLTLDLNLTNLLVVKVVDAFSKDYDNETVNSTVESWINATFNVFHINGTQFKGSGNFEYGNITAVWIYEPNASYRRPSSGDIVYNNTTTSDKPSGSGNYSINITTPSMPGGHYEVHINLTSKDGRYRGESRDVKLTAGNVGLHLTQVSLPSSLTIGRSKNYSALVKNFGPWGTGMTSIDEKINFTEDCGEISLNTTKSSSTLQDVELNGHDYTGKTFWWYIKGDTNGTCSYTIEITTGSAFNSISKSVSVSSAEEEEEAAGDGGDGGDGVTAAEPADYLDIPTYPETVSVEQGKSKSESVKVKNVNDTKKQDVTLDVVDINSAWYDVSPSMSVEIDTGDVYTYTVNFTVPATATVKDYSGQFKASSVYETVTKNFTLRVTPGPAVQIEINDTLLDYESQILELERELNESKEKGRNTTVAESKFAELKDKFNQAISYRDGGDYRSAYDLLDDIASLIDDTKIALEEAGKGRWWEWGKWVIIGSVAIGIGIFAYAFWPTPTGYEPGKGYRPPTMRKGVNHLKNNFKKLKEKWSRARGKPPPSYPYPSTEKRVVKDEYETQFKKLKKKWRGMKREKEYGE